jgi:hypothetical protein
MKINFQPLNNNSFFIKNNTISKKEQYGSQIPVSERLKPNAEHVVNISIPKIDIIRKNTNILNRGKTRKIYYKKYKPQFSYKASKIKSNLLSFNKGGNIGSLFGGLISIATTPFLVGLATFLGNAIAKDRTASIKSSAKWGLIGSLPWSAAIAIGAATTSTLGFLNILPNAFGIASIPGGILLATLYCLIATGSAALGTYIYKKI